MKTIILPESEYKILKQKSSLYEEFLKFVPKKLFRAESYSKKRIKEFLKEDRLDRKTAKRLEKLLQSR